MRVRLTNDRRKLLRQAKDCGPTSEAGLDACQKAELFKAIDVWERIDRKTVARYRCFEVYMAGRPEAFNGFCIQSKDVYTLPLGPGFPYRDQFIELLCEEAPHVRSGIFPTLKEAVNAFNKSFKK